jgi:hypothetical protein
MSERFPDPLWKRATNESYRRVPETCPAIDAAIKKARRNIMRRWMVEHPEERFWLAGQFDTLFEEIRQSGTVKLRRAFVKSIAREMRKKAKK